MLMFLDPMVAPMVAPMTAMPSPPPSAGLDPPDQLSTAMATKSHKGELPSRIDPSAASMSSVTGKNEIPQTNQN